MMRMFLAIGLIGALVGASGCGGSSSSQADANAGSVDARPSPADAGPVSTIDAGPSSTDDAAPAADASPPPNLRPVAVVADQTVLQGSVVTLSGEESSDPEGQPLTYAWSLRAAPLLSAAELVNDTAAVVELRPDQPGVYVIDLVVHDGVLESVPKSAIVTALATADTPIANAGPDRTVLAGSAVALSGSGSSDPNSYPLFYSWSLVSKPAASAVVLTQTATEQISFTPDVAGVYEVSLAVHNGSVASAADLVTVTAVEFGDTDPGDVANGVFNPGEVYLFGTLSEGACYRDAVAHWSEPNVATVGFDCYSSEDTARIRPDGTLVYVNTFEDLLREFHCDGCPGWAPGMPYPSDVLANDTILSSPPCAMDKISGFVIGITGDRLHRCSNVWYTGSGTALALTLAPLSFGYDNKVLTANSVVDIATGTAVPIVGLPGTGTTLTTRVAGQSGFWVARNVSGGQTQLWRVDYAGIASLEGTYPPPPVGHSISFGARLDSAGNLFEEGSDLSGSFIDVVIMRSITGLSEVVYTEADNPAVKLHISSLVTGP